jgi:hypothetical protein
MGALGFAFGDLFLQSSTFINVTCNILDNNAGLRDGLHAEEASGNPADY